MTNLTERLEDKASEFASQLYEQIQIIEKEYGDALDELAEIPHSDRAECSYSDIARVSKLGLALVNLVKAHRSMCDVRWQL